jgi:hypothetical protein
MDGPAFGFHERGEPMTAHDDVMHWYGAGLKVIVIIQYTSSTKIMTKPINK